MTGGAIEATCYNMLQHATTCHDMLQHATTWYNMVQHATTWYNMLQHATTCHNMPLPAIPSQTQMRQTASVTRSHDLLQEHLLQEHL